MPQSPPANDVAKLLESSQLLAEMPTAYRHKIAHLAKWLNNELGVSVTSGNEQCDLVFAMKVLQLFRMNVHRSQRFFYKYYKIRSADGYKEFFHDRNADSEEILKSCQSTYMFTIPRLTSEGHRITFIRLVPGVDIADFEPKALFKRFFMMSDIRFKEESDCNGDVFLIDLTGFTYSHAVKTFSGGLLTKFIKSLKETYPRRLQALHFLNVKPWHKKALSFALKMSKAGKKVNRKIGTHAENGDPIEGLDLSTEKASQMFQDLNDLWTKKLISYSSWFESQEALNKTYIPRKINKNKEYKKNEKLKKVKESQHTEVFTFLTLEGIFRQIDIDENE